MLATTALKPNPCAGFSIYVHLQFQKQLDSYHQSKKLSSQSTNHVVTSLKRTLIKHANLLSKNQRQRWLAIWSHLSGIFISNFLNNFTLKTTLLDG
jgi:hypothetical protein